MRSVDRVRFKVGTKGRDCDQAVAIRRIESVNKRSDMYVEGRGLNSPVFTHCFSVLPSGRVSV